MNPRDDYDEKEDMTFMERHKVVLSIVAVSTIAVGVFTLQNKFSSKGGSAHKSEMVSVRLPAPLPTPPPPPPTPPPVQDMKKEMIAQAPVDEHEEKPDDKPPEAAPVTTSIVGNGPDSFGLKAGNGSGLIGGSSSRQHSKWGWYASGVQSIILDALHRNSQFRTASLNLTARIWSDPSGRVTRAKLAGTSSDPKTEQALQDSLTGLQLKEPPPAGMLMPIVMRITAKRPN